MAKSIMIQGTMSNVGKSLLAAGLCRIFRQDGHRVAPFKSQNMALNSFITADGLEMGRAQVMQAEAAGIEPDVRMNPILLKPTTDVGSQVIVRGEVLGDMDARAYFAYKKSLLPMVLDAYRSLAGEYDILVIEGAGSPAEINLKADDIVNMGLARAVGAPVLLAGDIDRGGVFAQLLGTRMLLEPEEQALLKGLVINKFRGDRTILDPGIRMLEERGGVPVLGVVPFMQLDIDDEDSLSPQLSQTNRPPAGKPVEIAVIRLPHLSNFTDFNVFSRIPQVDLRYVSRPDALGEPDMVILPGTKSTIGDLRWLKETGMAAALDALHGQGRVLFGICGGYQMLGRVLADPDGVESGAPAQEEGLGFLPVATTFTGQKRRTRVQGRIASLSGALRGLSGMGTEGYEIHMGRTEFLPGFLFAGPGDPGRAGYGAPLASSADSSGPSASPAPPTPPAAPALPALPALPASFGSIRPFGSSGSADSSFPSNSPDGGVSVFSSVTDRRTGILTQDGAACGDVYGTYVHGIFDGPGIARAVAAALATRKGMPPEALFPSSAGALAGGAGQDLRGEKLQRDYKEAQYDLLAQTLRAHLDMEKIYAILEGQA